MYQYKHENGKIIDKVDFVVSSMGAMEYFDSPFVIAWWHINDKTGECDINKKSFSKYTSDIKNQFDKTEKEKWNKNRGK
jgi:hypothetical protein